MTNIEDRAGGYVAPAMVVVGSLEQVTQGN